MQLLDEFVPQIILVNKLLYSHDNSKAYRNPLHPYQKKLSKREINPPHHLNLFAVSIIRKYRAEMEKHKGIYCQVK